MWNWDKVSAEITYPKSSSNCIAISIASNESSPWSASELYLVTPRIFRQMVTIFIGGSEIVLNSFDNIWFNILFLFQYNLSSVDQLTVLVVSKIGIWTSSSSCLSDLFGKGESWNELDEIGEHSISIKIFVSIKYYYLLSIS